MYTCMVLLAVLILYLILSLNNHSIYNFYWVWRWFYFLYYIKLKLRIYRDSKENITVFGMLGISWLSKCIRFSTTRHWLFFISWYFAEYPVMSDSNWLCINFFKFNVFWIRHERCNLHITHAIQSRRYEFVSNTPTTKFKLLFEDCQGIKLCSLSST